MPAERRLGPITEDAVLDGTLRLRQPARGHRVGHDAILLAAACPARPGDHLVELGAGVGAAGLAVAARCPGTVVTLVEIDPDLVALAVGNAERNGLADRVTAVALDAAAPARAFAAVALAPDSFARVLMNPPFNDLASQGASPDRRRRLAHASPRGLLPAWVATAARLLRPRGTVTLIWRADGLAEVLRALDRAFGAVTVLPVYPKRGEPAMRILVRAAKSSRAPLAIVPGLVLNERSALPTAEAEAVLRGGATLQLAQL